jgi:hypothetical protein
MEYGRKLIVECSDLPGRCNFYLLNPHNEGFEILDFIRGRDIIIMR